MPTQIGGGEDSVFLDDFVLKAGSIGKFEEELPKRSPDTFFSPEWDLSAGLYTCDSGKWRAHYNPGWPVCFYHDEKFVVGFNIHAKGEAPYVPRVDFDSADINWTRFGPHRIVMEREDFPRFQTGGDVFLSHQLERSPHHDNVYHLGDSGYALATNKEIYITRTGAEAPDGTWWMVAPVAQAEALSRRVLVLKIYDGPYPYQARGTDIALSDPVPVASHAEYVIYSYDGDELRGLFRENYVGVAPQKKAFILDGEQLEERIVGQTGEFEVINGQIVGPVTVTYEFPLKAMKLLDVWTRGSELEVKIQCDDEPWTYWSQYDGKAVTTLKVQVEVQNALAALRVEWESLKDWEPVGRPYIDIIRPRIDAADDTQVNRNRVKITGHEGEGIGQTITIPTGSFTASADVRALAGETLVGVGGEEVVSWMPAADKWVRGAGDFDANAGAYEVIITGAGDNFSFEVDRFQVAVSGQNRWIEGDIQWEVETEEGIFPAYESVNHRDVPVSLTEARQFRVRARTPAEMGIFDEIAISGVKNTLYRTGDWQIVRYLRWEGSGKSRLHFPRDLKRPPVDTPWVELDGRGAISFEQHKTENPDDVIITLDGSPLSFGGEIVHRPIVVKNLHWAVRLEDEFALVYYDDLEVGRVIGRGTPLRVLQESPEDVQIDCSIGFFQMRRGLGPRFQGWELESSTRSTATSGAVLVFGIDDNEARENLPFYHVTVGR